MPQALHWVLCARRGDPAWVEGRFGRAAGGEQGTAHHQSPDSLFCTGTLFLTKAWA